MIQIQRIKSQEPEAMKRELNMILAQIEEQMNRELQNIEDRLSKGEQE